ncbi:MAG: hypothetical protein JW838_03060 [Spirochaetes bacterium]|nr:hypothetical protein [Spirochaetota bacterium]
MIIGYHDGLVRRKLDEALVTALFQEKSRPGTDADEELGAGMLFENGNLFGMRVLRQVKARAPSTGVAEDDGPSGFWDEVDGFYGRFPRRASEKANMPLFAFFNERVMGIEPT